MTLAVSLRTDSGGAMLTPIATSSSDDILER